MNKKTKYLFTSITVLIILIAIGIFIKMNNTKDSVFITKKLDANTSAFKNINDKVSEPIKENGVFLLNTGEDNVTYLILDASHMSLKNEVPDFSNVKIENKGNSIMIYFSEKLKIYPDGKYPELRLIYKITKDKHTEYIRAFKNGEETHFDSVIGA